MNNKDDSQNISSFPLYIIFGYYIMEHEQSIALLTSVLIETQNCILINCR